MPCGAPAGPTTDPSGAAPHLANLSPRQAAASGLLTSGIYGLPGFTSSASAALQSSLESRLRARTQNLGSTLYTMTWKTWATPSGRSRSRLRASARRTSETDSIGWPTPAARDWKGATLERWGTNARLLNEVVRMAGWPTTTASDSRGLPGYRSDGTPKRELPALAALAGWPTATANDATGSMYAYGPKDATGQRSTFLKLPGAVALLSDQSNDQTAAMHQHFVMPLLPVRQMACGVTLTGWLAGMDGGGQLDPAHSLWLMGLPSAWDACAPTATPSSRRQRKHSSKQ